MQELNVEQVIWLRGNIHVADAKPVDCKRAMPSAGKMPRN